MEQENKKIFRDLLGQVESPGFRDEYWKSLEERLDRHEKKRKSRMAVVCLLVLVSGTLATGVYLLDSSMHDVRHAMYDVRHTMYDVGLSKGENLPATTNSFPSWDSMYDVRHAVYDVGLSKRENLPAATDSFPSWDAMYDVRCTMYDVSLSKTQELPPITNLFPSWEGLGVGYVGELPEEIGINRAPQISGLQRLPLDINNNAPLKKVSLPGPLTLRKDRWSLDFAMGIHNVAKHIQANSTEGWYTVNRRRNEEHGKTVYSPRLNLSYFSKKGLVISLGLEYATYGERTAYRAYTLQEGIEKVINFVTDTIPVFNFTTRTTSWEKDTNIYITYDTLMMEKESAAFNGSRRSTSVSYFEVPLLVGYQYKSGGYGLAVRSGVSFGFLSSRSVRGQYLNTQGTGWSDLAGEKDKFTRMIANYHLQLRVSKTLCRKVSVFLEPSMKINLDNIYRNEISSQRYSSFGAYFGLSFEL